MAGSDAKYEYIVQDENNCGGQPRIAGSRLKAEHVAIEYVHLRRSPQEIVDNFPGITLAQVHAALAYYYDNRRQIDRAILHAEDFGEEMTKKEKASRP